MEKVTIYKLTSNSYKLLKPLGVTLRKKKFERHPCKRGGWRWFAECTELPELEGHGKTREEAVMNLEIMFTAFISCYELMISPTVQQTMILEYSTDKWLELRNKAASYLAYARQVTDVV